MYLEKVVKPRASLSAKPKQMAALLKKREPKMDMTKAQAAAEIKRMRKQAGDESIPQEARNKMLDRANEIERMFYEKKKQLVWLRVALLRRSLLWLRAVL